MKGQNSMKRAKTPVVHLSLPWGYIHGYDHKSNKFIGIYPRSQVSVYRTIGPLVVISPVVVLSHFGCLWINCVFLMCFIIQPVAKIILD